MSGVLEAPVSESIQVESGLPRLHKPNYRQTIIRCTLAILLTLCALEGWARYTISIGRPNVGPTSEYDKAYMLARTPLPAGKQLIVVVGGSFSKRAVYAEHIEKELMNAGYNVEVRNLATKACSAYEQLSLVELAAKSCGKPALIIADFRPLAFVKSYMRRTVDYEKVRFDESFAGRRYELGKNTDLVSKLEDFAESNFYLIGYRRTLRYSLLSWMSLLFDSEKFRITRANRSDSQEGESKRGWSPNFQIAYAPFFKPGNPGFKKRVGIIAEMVSPLPLVFTDEYTMPLRTFCAEKNIPLLYVWEPVHPVFAQMYEQAGVPVNKLKEQLQRLGTHPNTYVFDAHEVDKNADHFNSIDHVNYLGAMVFSDSLAQFLKQPPFSDFFPQNELADTEPADSMTAD